MNLFSNPVLSARYLLMNIQISSLVGNLDTGDNFKLALVIGIICIALIVIVLLSVLLKKPSHENNI